MTCLEITMIARTYKVCGRVLCVASQMINSRNGLSCKLPNVSFGIFHYQYFMCYNIYVVWFVHD